MRAEQLTPAIAYHGEGPMWDERLQRLLWVDLYAGDILVSDTGGTTDRWHVASVAACIVPRSAGGHVVATERGFTLFDADRHAEPLPDVWADAAVRMNDGACGPDGAFYCGSMAYSGATGAGALYRLGPDRRVDLVWDRVTISNGLGWSPDGSFAYYVDSPTRRIDRCPTDLSGRERFVEIPAHLGTPDGLTVDAEGGIWVALWGGNAVHRYGPDGRLDRVVELPVGQVSSCAFGGVGLDILFITTSAEHLRHPEPAAGALFAVRPGVKGQSTLPFSG